MSTAQTATGTNAAKTAKIAASAAVSPGPPEMIASG